MNDPAPQPDAHALDAGAASAASIDAALAAMRRATPARLFVGRAGSSYRTSTLLALRADHAAARDAVRAELDLDDPRLVALFTGELAPIRASTRAGSLDEYLLRPDLGRLLDDESADAITASGRHGADVQLVVGDGLSAHAVLEQVPVVLPALAHGLVALGLQVGPPIVVRRCRVGIVNDIGRLLEPEIVVVLIGERPGLAQAQSLSAYVAWRPRPGCTDADRNVVSNIHAAGTTPLDAVTRVLAIVSAMRAQHVGGVALDVPGPTAAIDRLPPSAG